MTGTTYRPFGEELRDLVIVARIVLKNGNPAWIDFARTVPGVHYETIRKALCRERTPTTALMARCAEALGKQPQVLSEYRLAELRARLDPAQTDVVDALSLLSRIEAEIPTVSPAANLELCRRRNTRSPSTKSHS